ncbi:hypothetical protein IWC96_02445 [Brevundimonas sp. BAL450]|uniref:Uncharacterized protein n=1 Tax=Brevundimonas abyssalis TAR-001 TaxID=1391729 RepID=A0A8E0NDD1_9CAUL|nr:MULTISPECIES: hypothetical protein [Brevundimonas]MBG7614141.1 hypothetical protein [Brevundimonas sp. BAL450]GAD60330.1 hypothetical protein MBEBAB_2580 [Brevundimonas abyssalis TAR-001]
MYLSFKRLGFLFLIIFAVLLIGVVLFRVFWTAPGERCEARGGWYDLETRTCAQRIYVPDITGRQPGESREEASRRNASELVQIERRIAAREAARRDAVEQERARIREAQRDD